MIDLSFNKIIPAQLLKIDNPRCKEVIINNNPGVLCQTLAKLHDQNLTVEQKLGYHLIQPSPFLKNSLAKKKVSFSPSVNGSQVCEQSPSVNRNYTIETVKSTENSAANDDILSDAAKFAFSENADVNSERAQEVLSKCEDGTESNVVESLPLDTLSEINAVPPESKAAVPACAMPPKPDQTQVDTLEVAGQPASDAGDVATHESDPNEAQSDEEHNEK